MCYLTVWGFILGKECWIIKVSIELFTTEIYANWVRKEELERWV